MTDFELTAQISKIDQEQQIVFGLFSVVTKNGEPVVDSEGDVISPMDLESAIYDYVLDSRAAGDRHIRKDVGQLIESFVITPDKLASMEKMLKDAGVKDVTLKADVVAAWGGFKITDEVVWKSVKSGEYAAFSIGGSANREKVDESTK